MWISPQSLNQDLITQFPPRPNVSDLPHKNTEGNAAASSIHDNTVTPLNNTSLSCLGKISTPFTGMKGGDLSPRLWIDTASIPYDGLLELPPHLWILPAWMVAADTFCGRSILAALREGLFEPITQKGPFLGLAEDECSMAEFCHLSWGIDVNLSVVRGYTESKLKGERIDLNGTEKPDRLQYATMKRKVNVLGWCRQNAISGHANIL